MSAPREHTSVVPIRSAQITKDLTTAHVIARDITEMQRTVNRVSSAKSYFELIIIFTVLTLTNDYFISKKKKQQKTHNKTITTTDNTNSNSNNEALIHERQVA